MRVTKEKAIEHVAMLFTEADEAVGERRAMEVHAMGSAIHVVAFIYGLDSKLVQAAVASGIASRKARAALDALTNALVASKPTAPAKGVVTGKPTT